MADPQQTAQYDDNGKPIAAAPHAHYDDNGNPLPASTVPPEHPLRGIVRGLLDTMHIMSGSSPSAKDVDTVINWLPVAGGATGGLIGGAGGTAFGFGFGGAPGAVGGATLGGASGEAVKQLANRFMGNPAPATSGQAAAQIGTQGAIQGGSELVGQLMTPLVIKGAKALMTSAVKEPVKTAAKALINQETPRVVKTLLDEGVNVTPGGINKLTDIINASNDTIADALNFSPTTAGVDPIRVAARIDPLAQRPGIGIQVNPAEALDAIQKAKDEFLAHWGTPTTLAQAQQGLTLPEAQALKVGTYKALKDAAYGSMKSSSIEAQKALALGLKEEIAKEAAASGIDISSANAREGAAIVARDLVAKKVAAAGNKDPGALAWLAHNPTMAIGYILTKSPAAKSLIANGLYQSAERVLGIPQNVIRTVVQAIAGGGGGSQ